MKSRKANDRSSFIQDTTRTPKHVDVLNISRIPTSMKQLQSKHDNT